MMSRNDADHTIRLQGIATALPAGGYTQEYALLFMQALPLYGEKERRFLDRLYPSTGIERRYTAVPDYGRNREDYEFFSRDPSMLPEPSPAKRNDLYITAAATLAEQAARKLMEDLKTDLSGVTHLITVSCTGFSAPGFDYHLVQTLGLAPTVFRTHIGFMGCYAAFPALRLAHTICSADSSAQVLIVDVELCSLHFQFKPDLETIVANAIFADGAAAALVSRRPPARGDSNRIAIRSFNSRIIPNSENEMSWRLGEIAFDMRLSAYVPHLIQQDIGEIVRTTMEDASMKREEVKLWAIHPGGRAILDRVREALELTEEDLADSSAVLREHGNMSSATIFFVLKRMLSGARSGPLFAAAFGPGLTVESAFFELVPPGDRR